MISNHLSVQLAKALLGKIIFRCEEALFFQTGMKVNQDVIEIKLN
jgi:hypothetical protein